MSPEAIKTLDRLRQEDDNAKKMAKNVSRTRIIEISRESILKPHSDHKNLDPGTPIGTSKLLSIGIPSVENRVISKRNQFSGTTKCVEVAEHLLQSKDVSPASCELPLLLDNDHDLIGADPPLDDELPLIADDSTLLLDMSLDEAFKGLFQEVEDL